MEGPFPTPQAQTLRGRCGCPPRDLGEVLLSAQSASEAQPLGKEEALCRHTQVLGDVGRAGASAVTGVCTVHSRGGGGGAVEKG